MSKYLIACVLFFGLGCSFEDVKYISDPSGKHFISYFPYFIKDTRHIIFTYGKVDHKELLYSHFISADKGFDAARMFN